LPGKCPIDIYEVVDDVKRPYEKLCVISVLVNSLQKAGEVSRVKACRCGADAVILRGGAGTAVGRGPFDPIWVGKKITLNVVAIRYTDNPPAAPNR
jgi:hypothetical protein